MLSGSLRSPQIVALNVRCKYGRLVSIKRCCDKFAISLKSSRMGEFYETLLDKDPNNYIKRAFEQGVAVSIPKLLISEIMIALLIGALPLVIVVRSNTSSDVVETLSALNPGDPVVIYLFYLLLLHLLVSAIHNYILKSKEQVANFFSAVHRFSHQIGFTIHSIYRAIAGALPAAICLLAYKHDFDSSAFIVSVASIFLVLGSLFMCCLFTWLNEKTKPKQKWL